MMFSDQNPITGRFVLFVILGFFAVTIGMNALFATLATKTFPGLETDEPYVRGLRYNDTLAERAAQAAQGWRAALTLDRDEEGAAVVDVVLKNAAGEPLTGVSVQAGLRHPTDAGLDRSAIPLQEAAPGRYVGRFDAVGAGEWTVAVSASAPGAAAFTSSNRLWLR